MRNWLAIVLTLFILAAACSSDGAQTSTTRAQAASTTVASTSTIEGAEAAVAAPPVSAQRLEDLDYLEERIISQHPNPYWRAGEAVYEAQLQSIRDRAADMTDTQFGLEVIRLVALVDGHSLVMTNEPPIDFQRLQIRTYQFEDGLFVLNSHDPEAIGGRVTAIGGLPVDEAMAAVDPYVSRDNDMTVRLVVPIYLTYVELLQELGVLDGETPAYTIETVAGEILELDPPALSSDELASWLGGSPAGLPPRAEQVASPSASPLYLTDPDRAFWWTYVEDSGTVFIQMNRVSASSSNPADGPRIGLHAVVTEVSEFVDGTSVDRVVLDLRHNPGGDNTTYGTILDLLSTHPQINQPGKLFVIAGRHTFSAAMNLATEIENETEAIFAGERTGARPNLYGDTNTLHLPNSRITVRISTRYWPFAGEEDTRAWIDPAMSIPLTSTDYFAGRDPVLDAVIAYQP